MSNLEKVIANLGYPVGMGMAPSPADLARMKSAIVNEWIEQLRREIEGHLKAWDIEHAEVGRLRALLKEARQYVSDAGSYEEPGEHQAALLADIDRALKGKP